MLGNLQVKAEEGTTTEGVVVVADNHSTKITLSATNVAIKDTTNMNAPTVMTTPNMLNSEMKKR